MKRLMVGRVQWFLSSCARSRVRPVGLVSVVVALALALLSLTAAGAAEQRQPQSTVSEPAGSSPPGREIEELRTSRSRTYVTADGGRVARLFSESVNYRDAGGGWAAIDNKLAASPVEGYAYRNKANRYAVDLPSELGSRPVRIAHDGAWVSFALEEARAAGTVEGATARYRDALPGVSVSYTATGDSVKEALTLAGAAAARDFSFSFEMSAGLEARENRQGGIDVLDAAGRRAFSFAPPSMEDAAGQTGAVQMSLAREQAGMTVRLSPDLDWIRSEARSFPVVVDPTLIIASAQQSCHIRNGAGADLDYCGYGQVSVGYWSSQARRTLLRFDTSAVPEQAQVLRAKLGMYAESRDSTMPTAAELHQLTRSWNGDATWNRYDGSNAWTTAGGDFAQTAADSNSEIGEASSVWEYWYPSELVQGWVDGSIANNGLLIKQPAENVAQVVRFAQSGANQPFLDVRYEPRTGLQRHHRYESQRLSDRISAHVNVANGNLVLDALDLRIAGTGLDMEVRRTYNSQSQNTLSWCHGWSMGSGRDVRLEFSGDTSAFLYGPTGYAVPFQYQGGGAYRSPTAIDATLKKNTDLSYTLSFHQSEEKLEFAPTSGGSSRLTAHKDRNANQLSFAYNSSDRLERITDTQARETDFAYTSGVLSSVSDPSGRDLAYECDGGDLTDYVDADNKTTEYAYDANHNLTRLTDPRGNQTKFAYDSSDRLSSITRVTDTLADSGPTTSFDYDQAQKKTTVTDPRGKQTVYSYDVELRVTKVVDANGHERTTSYTSNSNVDTFTDGAGGPVTDSDYDSRDNLTKQTEPAGEIGELEYTSTAHPYSPTKQTSPQGTSQVFAYDTPGNLTSVNDGQSPTQVEAKLEYNGQSGGVCPNDATTKPGTLRCAIDGNANQTLYQYDDNGNLTKIVPELPLGATTLTYDTLSRVKTITDGKSQTRTYSYDPLDRVTEIAYSNGQTIDYSYDGNGNRTQRVDSVDGTSSWSYDKLNRKTQDVLTTGTVDYGWDAASNLTSLTDGGGSVSYRYNDVNLLQDVAEPGGSCTSTPTSRCTSFGYTVRDQRDSTAYPNGVTQTVSYDSSDKPTQIKAAIGTNPPLTKFDYTYIDPATPARKSKLVWSVTDKDANTTSYSYDFLDRLIGAVERNSANTIIDDRAYSYDAASNRTSQTINSATTTYEYNDANQLCWWVPGSSTNACGSPPTGATSYSYDANGNETANSAGRAFTLNIRDQNTSYTAPGGSAVSWAYAGEGQTERTTVAGTTQRNNMLGLGGEGSTYYTRDTNGTLISQRASSRHYYLTDQLGSTIALTDTTGAVARTYKYDPYGNRRSTTGSLTQPFQFTGEYQHSGDLYKIGARYYDTTIGRWTQQDPLDQAGDLRDGNRYAYAAADPVNLIDPSGLISISGVVKGCIDGVSGKVGAGGPVIVKVGSKFVKVLPGPSKLVDCGAGGLLGAVGGLF